MANIERIIRKGLSNNKTYLVHKLKNGMKCLIINQKEEFQKYTVEKSTISVEETDEIEDSLTDSSYSSDEENSQNKSDMFTLSLTVNVGSFSDPIEAQGLAHLLEHMILMGSERYPIDNHFDQFINRNSGSSNARTECEYTNYYFEVPTIYSQEASDIFASMLQAPKLAKESIDKEKQVVDSEFKMAIPDEDSRTERLLSICANKENPAGKFSFGNLKSLNHDNLNELVFNFWKNHYSASHMALAVQSRLPIDEITEWIDKLFNEVPTNNQPKEEFKISKEPFDPNLFHRIFKIKSVSSTKHIQFYWYLPPVVKLYKTKPLEYISWIVDHAGEGTLINYLRKLNYAMELDVGTESDLFNTSIYSIFYIDIELTDLGYTNIHDVIELTFSYLNLVKEKGISEHIFEQIKIVAENDFNFSENTAAIDHVSELSKNMLIYEEEDYLSGPTLFYEYSPEIIENFLKLLTVDRVAVFILAKEFDNLDLFIKEPIFEIQYLAENFIEELENKWSIVKPNPFFKIPYENRYLTTNFSILPQIKYVKYPEKILENDYIELWFKQDNHFKLPRTYAMFYFISSIPSKSLENYMLYDLFFDTVLFLLHEEAYLAGIGKLKVTFHLTLNGFECIFDGFNEKLPLFIEVVMNCIKDFKILITENIFTMVKSKAINKLKTNQHDLDYVLFDLKQSLNIDPQWHLEQRLKYEENINYKQLLKFSEQFNNFYCKALIQGNIDQTQAIEISSKVVNILNYQPLSKECFPVIKINRFKHGDLRLSIKNSNPNDNNSMSYKYYQFDRNELSDAVKYEVLQSIINECAFDELRTKQCLGYDVEISMEHQYDYYGVYFKVAHQIDKFKTEYVFNRMDTFLEEFWKNFNNPDEIDKVIYSLIKLKESPDNCLEDEFDRNRYEIRSGRFKFNKIELQIEALKNLKFDDVKNLKHGFLDGHILSIEIIGNHPTILDNEIYESEKCTSNKKRKKNLIYIEDLEEFKNSLHPY